MTVYKDELIEKQSLVAALGHTQTNMDRLLEDSPFPEIVGRRGQISIAVHLTQKEMD